MWPPLLVLLILFVATGAQAECQCLWQGSFAEVQDKADLVASGTVVATKGNSIDLRIDRKLRGPATVDIIRIWLQTADYCRPPTETFPLESTWLMALQRIDRDVPGGFNPGTPNISYGRVGDYQLSSCGGYWLQVTGDYVTGALVQSPRWEREPKMTPVLLDLVAAFVHGKTDAEALLHASREDPALRELKLDTRAFLRGDPE